MHVNPMGLISMKNKPKKWRPIVELSSLEGRSVNNGISKECWWQKVEKTWLVKAEAYQEILVHLKDRPLLSIRWDG